MLRLNNVILPVGFDFSDLIGAAAGILGCPPERIRTCRLWRRSVDARHGAKYVCSLLIELTVPEERFVGKDIEAFTLPAYQAPARLDRKADVCVVGFGPAGLFCALTLARAGFRPTVIERGGDIASRTEKVARFWQSGELDEDCNVQFGEGGAGAFSDGKLSTGISDPRCRYVLETFVSFGAPSDILVDARPHIGTDLLRPVITNMRQELLRLGGNILFNTKLESFSYDNFNKLILNTSCMSAKKSAAIDAAVLALGHSARDTMRALHAGGFQFSQKAFSIGARIEHLQADIDAATYRTGARAGLPPAEYRLSAHLPNGRSAYTFCMCPGGVVVAASSQKGGVSTNGMSFFARDSLNANSALLVGVSPEDFPSPHPLAGLDFQEHWERAAFAAAGSDYRAPAQTVGDFLNRRPSRAFEKVRPSYLPAVTPGEIDACLPGFAVETLRLALPLLGRRLRGFDDPEAVLTAPETRSSSPARMLRDEDMRALGHPRVYPCGEGAGYAGGIVSAAVDGIRTAEKICAEYR